MPNTSPSSEVIKDEQAAVKKKLSEYPKEKIEEYNLTHKKYLKEVLSKVIDQDFVYMDKFGDLSINYESPPNRSEEVKLSDLTKEQLAKILHTSQSIATKKSKKEIFQEEE